MGASVPLVEVTPTASPLLSEIRMSGLLPERLELKRTVPSALQVPPSTDGTPVIVRTDPPSMSIRLSLASAENPTDRLSGDQERHSRAISAGERPWRRNRVDRAQPQAGALFKRGGENKRLPVR